MGTLIILNVGDILYDTQLRDVGILLSRKNGSTGISYKSLHDWVKRYNKPTPQRQAEDAQAEEIRKLKAELRRVTEERDILKEAAVYFAGESKKSTRS